LANILLPDSYFGAESNFTEDVPAAESGVTLLVR
jgi:hypothetical protein